MKKIGFLLMLFFAVVQATFAQIEYRNNCLDSCNLQTNTVFELKTPTPYPTGTTFTWTIDGRTYPVQTDKSSIVHQFRSKNTYSARVEIVQPGLSPVIVTKNDIHIGAIMSGGKYGFMINGVVKDTLIELCTGAGSTSLAVPITYNPSNYTFRWFPNGETSQSINVDKEGCYSVKVFENGDLSGCFYEAKSNVKICGSYPNKPVSPGGSGGTGTAASVPECVNCPQWDLGNNVKVIFPTDGRPPYSESIPSTISYNAPANVAYVSIYNKGANYQIGGLNSNGREIIDNQNNLLGSISKGDVTLSNGVAFIPKSKCKGCSSMYYLISTATEGAKKYIYFHTIDLALNGGKGGILSQDNYLSNIPVSEKLSILKTSNGYQILTLDEKGEKLLSFNVDEKGISEPTITTLNAPAGGNTMGNMNLSVDNTKLAIALPPNKIKILNTNPVSNVADLTVSTGDVNGLCFSPDGNLLYVSVNNSSGSSVLQFKLDTTNIQASNKYVMSASGKLGAIQLDPARRAKLYITREGSSHFFTIDRPNSRIYNSSTATSAGVNDLSALITAGNLGLGLPVAISESSPDSPPSISMECKGTTYTFKLDKDLCEKNKNTRVVWELWYANTSEMAINPQLDISTGQKILRKTVAEYPNNRKFVKVNSSGTLNQIDYDFKINTSAPDPDGYYVVVVRLDNACVSNYLLDAQAFYVRNLKPYLLPSQFDIIRAPLNCPPSAVVTIKASPASSSPLLDTYNDRYFTVPNFPIDYKWILPNGDSTFADQQQILYPQGKGNYSVQIRDPETSCKINSPTKVVFYTPSDLPPVYNWNICMDEAFPLTKLEVFPSAVFLGFDWKVTAVPPASNLGHILNPIPSTQNFINVDKPGEYQIEIRDNGGCILNKNYIVDDKCLPEVIAPTVFNPRKINSDGSIPRFYPLYNWPMSYLTPPSQETIPGSSPARKYEKNRVKALSFKVFNRWGQLVFERDFNQATLEDPSFEIKRNGWDGTYNGNLVPQDTYAWVIEYESKDFPNLGKQSKSGAVLVVY